MTKQVNLFLPENKYLSSLSQMLSAILLLLQLWDSGAQETDNERSAQGTSAPLLPLLQRFQSIICSKDMPHTEGDTHVSITGNFVFRCTLHSSYIKDVDFYKQGQSAYPWQ